MHQQLLDNMYQIIEDPESEMQIIEKSLGAIESSIDQSNNKIPMTSMSSQANVNQSTPILKRKLTPKKRHGWKNQK